MDDCYTKKDEQSQTVLRGEPLEVPREAKGAAYDVIFENRSGERLEIPLEPNSRQPSVLLESGIEMTASGIMGTITVEAVADGDKALGQKWHPPQEFKETPYSRLVKVSPGSDFAPFSKVIWYNEKVELKKRRGFIYPRRDFPVVEFLYDGKLQSTLLSRIGLRLYRGIPAMRSIPLDSPYVEFENGWFQMMVVEKV
ncbi:hypothetical protein ES703_90889 [subsurface metagenome]